MINGALSRLFDAMLSCRIVYKWLKVPIIWGLYVKMHLRALIQGATISRVLSWVVIYLDVLLPIRSSEAVLSIQ